MFLEAFKAYIKSTENQIKKLKTMNCPTQILNNIQRDLDKCTKKLETNKYKPTLTMKDGIDKQQFCDVVITKYVEEYNRNNKLVAVIINDEYKINYNTIYCPIVTRC